MKLVFAFLVTPTSLLLLGFIYLEFLDFYKEHKAAIFGWLIVIVVLLLIIINR